jgi:hypothetical protein
MDKKDWMQKYFLEYRENKRWCIDTSKGSVSRLDVLKDKSLWTKPGFDMHPTMKNVVDKRKRTVVVTISVIHNLKPGDDLYDTPLEHIEKRDIDMIKKLGFSDIKADSAMEGYYLCSDS